jgi:hypothetical protein
MIALAIQEDAVILPDQGRTTETGLDLRDNLTFAEWAAIGHTLGRAVRASAWWIGDWINYGEDRGFISGEKYDAAQEISRLKRKTLVVYAFIARTFPKIDRNQSLTPSHHRVVASLEPDERKAILDQAAEERWGVDKLRTQLARASGNGGASVPEIATPRQRQNAEAAKLRVERAVGTCNGLARGLVELKVEYAVCVAAPDEISGWDASIRDAISALNQLRNRLREATA